jgi:hypothetical protein
VTEPFRIGRGVFEGDITSPQYFNIGIEVVFREADELNSALVPIDGVEVRGVTVDKVGFADDITVLASDAARATTTVQNIQYVSSTGAGIRISLRKSYVQHIGMG